MLLKTSYREDHNTVISYISVWWEVALEIDFFQKTDLIKFIKMQIVNLVMNDLETQYFEVLGRAIDTESRDLAI